MKQSVQSIIDSQIQDTGTVYINDLICRVNDRVLSYDEALDVLAWANSFERIPAFLKLRDQVKDPASYWRLLAGTYQMSDNLFQWRDEIRECFLSEKPFREQLMEQDEKQLLSSLPDHLTIYRGMTVTEANSGNYGISWTLSREIAEFFAYEYWRNIDTNNEQKTVVSKQIRRDQIIALFNSRNEKEVIYIQ